MVEASGHQLAVQHRWQGADSCQFICIAGLSRPPWARESEAPMRVKMASVTCSRADVAGTKQPICAMIAISATCRM